MNYISFLTDYNGVLSDIVADWPLSVPSPLPESYLGSPNKEESIWSPIAVRVRLAWLILVMLCILDGKAEIKYVSNYERIGWSKVIVSLPGNPTAEEIPVDQVIDHFRNFNSAFEEAYKKQSAWVVPDPKLRDEIKMWFARRMGPVYKELFDNYGGV
ncbi:hypothetical protein V6N13_019652 [Hibiscus sabdariffa]|uniref:Exocyst subunit Exo70 family protein n=1 Tax=Hibiscus sabdariffa TaxID=183260 RepID=A0ABR2ELP9_9ROSI